MGVLRRHAVAIAVAAIASVVIVWLWRDNRRLTRELAARPAHAAAGPGATAIESARDDDTSQTAGKASHGSAARPTLARLGALARAIASSPTPGPDGGVDPDARRNRRQRWIRGMLGRSEGESEDDYRARVQPLVQMALAGPRARSEQRRKDFELAADVTPEQHAKLDAAFGDAYAELLAGADKSVAAGDLTPYKRNPRGVLSFIGGTVATVDSVDDRMRKILSPEQLKTMEGTDFDMVEYLATTAPWEKVHPPPVDKK